MAATKTNGLGLVSNRTVNFLAHLIYLKKRHTRKHLAAVDETKRVIVLSKARVNKLHDKRFHKQDDIASNVPESIPIEVTLGFQGLQNQYENSHLPPKKPRGGALSEVQKQENPCWSESRVIWENAFAGVKGYNAVSVVYRNRIVDFDDDLMLTAAGLENFYLMAA